MRARGGLLEKKGEAWTRGQRVNDLLYRSLPASSRFLPVCIEPGYHPVSWNNCDRSWVRQVERNEYETIRSLFVLRILWIISCRIQPSSWHCAPPHYSDMLVRMKRYLVNEHGT